MSENGFNVLIIDDEEVDRLLASRCLVKEGQVINVIEACSLEEALEVTSQNEIDVVLLDLTLRQTSGLETLHEFQKQHCTNYPIVLLSSRWGNSGQFVSIPSLEKEPRLSLVFRRRAFSRILSEVSG